MKKKTLEQILAEHRKEIVEQIEWWKHLNDYGGNDPFWTDGVNMELVRNHIIYYKRKISELCEENGLPLPEEYYLPLPPEVDRNYMAKADEIRENAKKSLSVYLQDDNYKYLIEHESLIGKKDRGHICLYNVIGYAKWLEKYIEKDDLVSMRRHERPETYLDSFQECRKKMKKILREPTPEKLGQMDIFDFI